MTNTAREEVVRQQCSRITRGRKDACRNKCHADVKISRLSIRKLEGLWEFQIKRVQVDLKGLMDSVILNYMAFSKCEGD